MTRLRVAVVSVLMLSGCTKWGARSVMGPPREIGRRWLGSPSITQTSSGSLDAGFGGARGGGVAIGGLGGSVESMKRTFCAQQAEITYERDVETVSVIEGRQLDWAGAVALMFLGAGVMVAGRISQESVFEPGDPLYETPRDPMPFYAGGGAMIGAGIALIGYSYLALPRGPAPQPTRVTTTETQTQLVEATGCGLPGDPAAPVPEGDTATRLQKLDDLRAAGTISEEEYQRKRQEIIDAL